METVGVGGGGSGEELVGDGGQRLRLRQHQRTTKTKNDDDDILKDNQKQKFKRKIEKKTQKILQVLSLMALRIGVTLVYVSKTNFSEIVRIPWALRDELPLYGLSLAAYSLFNGRFLISFVNEGGGTAGRAGGKKDRQ